MRILKLYVDNFKGVANPTIIDFEKDINILKGPNGFGKTTIFDALELCITGEIYRTKVYGNVTEDRTDYSDAFYRNKKNKDMVLNLLIEGYEKKKFTIVKILSAGSTGRTDEAVNTKRYKTSEWGIIDTYLLGEEGFGIANGDTILSDKLSQDDIESAVLGTDGGSLTDLYRIFAYLQQAENTFYLKKTERDRRAELDHLFRTDSEAEILKKISDRLTILNKWTSVLDDKIESLGEVSDAGSKVDYVRLFHGEDYKYDSLHPYVDIKIEHIDESHRRFRSNLDEIQSFINSFDPVVYEKNKTKQEIIQLANSKQFLDYIALSNLTDDETYNKLRRVSNLRKYIGAEPFLKYFLLQNFLTDTFLQSYSDSTKYFNRYTEYTKSVNRPVTVEDKLKFISNWTEEVSRSELETVRKYLEEIRELNIRLDDAQSTVNDLFEIRENMKTAFEFIPKKHKEGESCECPFCGFDWKDTRKLGDAIELKTIKFNQFLQGQAKTLNELKKKIENEFLVEFEERIEQYLIENKRKYNFLQVLNDVKNASGFENFSNYAELLKDIVEGSNLLVWTEIKTANELESDVKSLRTLSLSQVSLDEDVFSRITALIGYKFDESVKFVESRKLSVENLWTLSTVGNINQLNTYVDEIRSKLVEDSQSIEIDTEKLGGNLSYMFKDYFEEDTAKLQIVSANIKQKISYLDAEYQNNRRNAYRVLSERLMKLRAIKDITKDAKTKYENELKKYKREMIEKIKLPFYVYTAKILQNYQQGMGVFIASSKANSDAIRFLTESESNHDIVHHLSSGQLAVVSIAFTLAINKVYGETSLNILAIDDPVYELDSLNVFSFVELLRRSFMGQYQIILSTHDDDSAFYMKYRFEKIEDDTVALIDVQDTFFKPRIS